MEKKIKKNFLWNVIGSTFNASVSLFFMILVTRINGVNNAGIFTFAFSTSCLLQVIGIYSGRAYQVTETNKKITDSDFLHNKIITCLIMGICAIIFVLLNGYNLFKSFVIIFLVLYKMVEAFSETIYAIIQKNDDLYKVGISLFLKGILGILLFGIIDILTKNLLLSIIMLVVANILVVLFYDFKNLKEYNIKKNKFNKKNTLLILKCGFWTFLFTLLTQYIINAQKYAIDGVLAEKYQTIFGIILMPATVLILCGQFLVHPFLVKITDLLKNNEDKKLISLLTKLSLCILIIGSIGIGIAYLIGIPFLELIYGLKLKTYLYPLLIIIAGAVLYAIAYIISNVLIAMRKTFIQVIIFGIVSVFTLIVSNYLVTDSGVLGASVAYFSSMALLLILYIIVFIVVIIKRKKLKK